MKRVLKYLPKYYLLILIPSIAMLIGIGLDMINPYLVQILIDKVVILKEYEILTKLLIYIGIISLLRSVLGYIKEYCFDYMSTKVTTDIKKDLFDHIQSLSFSYFDNMNTGELMSRIGEDVENVWKSLGFGINLIIENILYFIIASIILFRLNWILAIICLSTMPLLIYITTKLKKETDSQFDKISDEIAILNTTAQENIAGVRLIKAFAREKYEILKFLKLNNNNYNLNVGLNYIRGKYNPLQDFLGNISTLLVVCVGGILVIKDSMSIGTLVAFNSYIWMLIWPIRMIGTFTNVVSQGSASAKKIDRIFKITSQITSPKNPIQLNEIVGNIEFKNVTFKYNKETVLKNINLKIPAKSTVAIMGSTGSGKSSLINLIGRYYDVTSGSVLIDGVNVKSINLDFLRSQMAVVPQDIFLFSDTIENNIKFSNVSASQSEIEKACSDSCALNFIDELEDGFNTIIGERGIGLSGGQKQRLSIARALVKNSKILILDDSTSALDMDTEYNLLKNLYNRNKKITTFIIAHRISAVKNADIIIFLDKGEIVEIGTHEELINKKGYYYEIYLEQFESLKEDEVI
ncbi:ABC-type multidrug transport system, ATPase and permease component [Clostridium pasteurianum DSM 525 = ATCC 6013]|uniref:ABC-type multidrug transport system, ATPase and permease component n=1 Tax=Clostridium pasteurianum DSM 525 = ATCC 6013 TaxID=1262449 RepID=A0A0H3JBI6_CLOPA|nr:ABC transporter ATP-binding protein [Clostridium pasteurianum]AJA49795.1 ABC-type multidrug transport system, ATPase and permease component [Clostridium pasteurianum DSM 525 = ATCC 6013]AJA53783.1 ABC-type multidrug transport system, ATPase and permease component [Clostridium pasteurianum DSM 525 = ATCC 6013]AOZ76946.1 ABC transporter [Clostridium pasteurianum DSM 525 = ATCC 6013]AOZ80743.1 ABC transporter [Clostridium pasteurianum]ELP57698.1 ABC transporter [Clostridium pasteurianum DSM 52